MLFSLWRLMCSKVLEIHAVSDHFFTENHKKTSKNPLVYCVFWMLQRPCEKALKYWCFEQFYMSISSILTFYIRISFTFPLYSLDMMISFIFPLYSFYVRISFTFPLYPHYIMIAFIFPLDFLYISISFTFPLYSLYEY